MEPPLRPGQGCNHWLAGSDREQPPQRETHTPAEWLEEAVMLLLRGNCAAQGRRFPQKLVPLWRQWHQTRPADADLGRCAGDASRGCDVDRHVVSGSSGPASEPCDPMCMKHSAGQSGLVHNWAATTGACTRLRRQPAACRVWWHERQALEHAGGCQAANMWPARPAGEAGGPGRRVIPGAAGEHAGGAG